ncbi:ABC transporter substrate-binding protein [Salinibacterium sp. dk2585]|uniref:ABC transporter substrate-binding protein n=1 Tax=unclassified Salinibacterium TaxID=2632331 RepID=UPI0011C24F63|nr:MULTISPECIES: ABC transporter substrate-binding protein [unclassified Salinibacterium]QEE62053.1 ABC transporter substrate-binding protein [Salinibacterium sp. dk2585]TXK53405.1 ABC transporter substrate-binding protein [Salinibacterium sp. dk5596]
MKNTALRTATVVIASTLFLAGCSSAGGDNAKATDDGFELVNQMPAATKGLDHTLRWMASEPPNIDPSFTGLGQMIYSNMCENISMQLPDYSIEPNLGTIERPDELTYEITLRDDVTFWDGSPMTAADAVWTFSRQLDPNLGSNFQAYIYNIAGVEQTGEYTFTISMKAPDVMLEPLLATGFGAVHSKAWGEANPGKIGTADGGLMCTGPYIFEKWTPGAGITMTKNPNYWDESRAALTEKVEFVFNDDPTSVVASMVGGDLDGGFDFSLAALEQLKNSTGTVTFGPSLGFWNVLFVDVPNHPLSTEQRRALMLALDYEGIIKGVLKGAAEEDRALTPRTSWGYSEEIYKAAWDELDGGRQDMEEAEAIIAEVGLPDEAIVIPYRAESPEMNQIANAIASAADSLGMKAELRAFPQTQYSQFYRSPEAREAEGIDMYIMNGYMDAIPEPTAWYLNYITGRFGHIFNVENPASDEWVSEASHTLDDDARAELMVKAQQYYNDEMLMMAVAAPYTRVWTAQGVTGAPASDTYRVWAWAAAIGAAE